jgi:hypothetical protein
MTKRHTTLFIDGPRPAGALLPLLVVAALLGGTPGPVGAAVGEVNYDSTCDDTDRDYLDGALRAGRIAAMSDAFAECIDDRLASYQPCHGYDSPEFVNAPHDQRVQAVLEMARSTNDLFISCNAQTGGAAHGEFVGYQHTSDEEIHLTRETMTEFLDPNFFGGTRVCSTSFDVACTPPTGTDHLAAGLIWHEIMHSHGFAHSQPDTEAGNGIQCGAQNKEYALTDIVRACISAVIYESGFTCGVPPEALCGADGQMMLTSLESSSCECVEDACLDPIDLDGDGSGDACEYHGELEAAPGSLTFTYSSQYVFVGSQTVTLRSVGADPVAIGTLATGGLDHANFEIRSDGCSGQNLAPGQDCDVAIDFRAGAYSGFYRALDGDYRATLDVPSTANSGLPDQVQLRAEHATAKYKRLIRRTPIMTDQRFPTYILLR